MAEDLICLPEQNTMASIAGAMRLNAARVMAEGIEMAATSMSIRSYASHHLMVLSKVPPLKRTDSWLDTYQRMKSLEDGRVSTLAEAIY